MDRNDVSWQGYWAACPTPYGENGELDWTCWSAARALHRARHARRLVNGTTGEWFSQTHDERRLVAETAIEHVVAADPGRGRLHRLHGQDR